MTPASGIATHRIVMREEREREREKKGDKPRQRETKRDKERRIHNYN